MLCAFDFDGTLADSKPVYYKAIKVYSDQKSLKFPDKADMDLVFGNPNPPIAFEGWGSLEGFTNHLNNIYDMTDGLICDQPSDVPLFQGISELLRDLGQDFTLSIVTSRSLKPIQALIHHHKIQSHFKTIRSDQDIIDRGYRGKPHPDKLNCVLKEMVCPSDRSVMVGDTLMDMAMAKSAGSKAIGVSWGYHDEATLRSHGADEVVNTPQELNQVIRSLFKH
jgi:phosphoglycolate phosphatase